MTVTKNFRIKATNKKLYSPVNKTRRRKKLARLKKKTRHDSLKRIAIILFILIVSISLFSGIYALMYLQRISADLPSPDKPFGKKDTATEIYDRNGRLLYRIFDREDRDPVVLEDLPPLLTWTYLAAEDIRFYDHEGVDPQGIAWCAFMYLQEKKITCGGSTVTQQLIRKTALTDEVNFERKLKEMLLAMKIEQERNKDEIMEMYLTIVPSGSNIYGVTRAANFYFDKDPKDLNLAEMAVLAAIPQNPSVLSPTKSTNPEISKQLLDNRVRYVFDQLESNMDYINYKLYLEYGKDAPFLNKETIRIARKQEITFRDPAFNITAPHFVFYTLDELQTPRYNDGKGYTLEEIETQGLRIYTTLDYDLQKSAESHVKQAVETYGRTFGADNAGMVVTNPRTGEVLAMVGSYSYFGKASPEGCNVGINCKYEPQVNLVDSRQAYGSTLKPIIYYQAFMEGMLTPESPIGDLPIRIGKYEPKNYEGDFTGVNSARYMLVNSRNIPAIILLDEIGVSNFLNILRNWGYTTFDNPAGYGLSLAVGGGEVTLLEHAQSYGAFANEGKVVKNETVLRITDQNGELLYDYTPEAKQVADPRGIYLVNDILNAAKSGPGINIDGRDMAGKTGTSEDQKETLYVAYSPVIVVAGILGNNDNTPMAFGATGLTSVRPWVGNFLLENSSRFGSERFSFPQGVVQNGRGDLFIEGISNYDNNINNYYPYYLSRIPWRQ